MLLVLVHDLDKILSIDAVLDFEFLNQCVNIYWPYTCHFAQIKVFRNVMLMANI